MIDHLNQLNWCNQENMKNIQAEPKLRKSWNKFFHEMNFGISNYGDGSCSTPCKTSSFHVSSLGVMKKMIAR